MLLVVMATTYRVHTEGALSAPVRIVAADEVSAAARNPKHTTRVTPGPAAVVARVLLRLTRTHGPPHPLQSSVVFLAANGVHHVNVVAGRQVAIALPVPGGATAVAASANTRCVAHCAAHRHVQCARSRS